MLTYTNINNHSSSEEISYIILLMCDFVCNLSTIELISESKTRVLWPL